MKPRSTGEVQPLTPPPPPPPPPPKPKGLGSSSCSASGLLRDLVAAIDAENNTRLDGDPMRYLKAKAETLSIATKAEEFLEQNSRDREPT